MLLKRIKKNKAKKVTISTITEECRNNIKKMADDSKIDEKLRLAEMRRRSIEDFVNHDYKTYDKAIEFTAEEYRKQTDLIVELREKAKEAGYNHKATVTYIDDSVEEFYYYWVEGKDGKLFLYAGLKDNPLDLIVTLDMKRDVKSVQLG